MFVWYSTVGFCSGAYALRQRKLGMDNVKNMGDGALMGYALEGKPLVTADGKPADSLHTLIPGLAGLVPDNLMPVSYEDGDARLAAAQKQISEEFGL